jgi:hypothetical protein
VAIAEKTQRLARTIPIFLIDEQKKRRLPFGAERRRKFKISVLRIDDFNVHRDGRGQKFLPTPGEDALPSAFLLYGSSS